MILVNTMKRTKILSAILVTLVILLISFLIYINYDKILIAVNNIIYYSISNKIDIPGYTVNQRNYEFKTVKPTSNFYPKNIDEVKEVYYTVLNNGWDSFTFYCDKDYTNCKDDIKDIANDSEYISLINNYVSPFNAYKKYNTLIIGDYEINLTVDKLYSQTEINLVNKSIDDIIKSLKINTTNPTQDDLLKFHDYLISNVKYDDDYIDNDIYSISNKANGALIEKIALCSGYTDAFGLFLDRLNIPNFKVTTTDHVWNVVYFNNKWLHVDVTWDDDEYNSRNRHNFFLIDTNKLLEKDAEEHTFKQELYLELN